MNRDVNLMFPVTGYQITEVVYAGDRTLVYRATRNADRLPVIIKLLKNPHPTFKELVQFRNQFTIAKKLDVSGIIKLYSLEPYQNGYALVMEDCGGVSLSELVKNQPLTLEQFLAIAVQLATILHQLHQQRIIHKDIKPANILICPNNQEVKLIDFSISTLLPREIQQIQSPNTLEGSLDYLSPEQTGRMNRSFDYRSDFYSLGVTFFELLTGQLPFQATTLMELIHCHIAKQPPMVHSLNPAVPSILSRIVSKLMAKNAEDRYRSALGLSQDLELCRSQLRHSGQIEPFELGQQDFSDRFLIPERLYGREQEVAALLAAFERVAGSRNGEVRSENGEVSSFSLLHSQFKSELILVAGSLELAKRLW